MTEMEEPEHEEVAQLITDAARCAANQPWALTPEQVRGQSPSRTSWWRWRRPGLHGGIIGLAAAVLVAVAVAVVLVTGSSPPSSAQVRQKIAAAEALSFRAGTIRADQTTTQ